MRCKWAKHKASYAPNLRLLDAVVATVEPTINPSSSWVRIAKNPVDGVYEFRCICCKACASRSVQWGVLPRHHTPKMHRIDVHAF